MTLAKSQHTQQLPNTWGNPADKPHKINGLLNNPAIWRASQPVRQQPESEHHAVPTGFRQLDQQLALGGWPLGQMVECLLPNQRQNNGLRTQGALHVLLPAIRQLSNSCSPVILIAPPFMPYLPGWFIANDTALWVIQPGSINEQLWATEQVLQSNCASVVISWLDNIPLRMTQLRKLQLAARYSQALFVAIRDITHQQQPSAAALRYSLTPRLHRETTRLAVNILKQPGRWGGQTALIHWHNRLQSPVMPAQAWPVYYPAPSAADHNTSLTDRLTDTKNSVSTWS